MHLLNKQNVVYLLTQKWYARILSMHSELQTMWPGKSYILSNSHKKSLSTGKAFVSVVMDGIEPPTQGFSVLCSTN